MKRLYLTVEGQTEEQFAMTLLRPHLANFSVFMYPPRFTGPHGRRGGRIPRGGLLHTFQMRWPTCNVGSRRISRRTRALQ